MKGKTKRILVVDCSKMTPSCKWPIGKDFTYFGMLNSHCSIGNIIISKIVIIIGVVSHTFYCNFCQGIEYSLLYWEHRYIQDRYIGVPLYCEDNFFHLS